MICVCIVIGCFFVPIGVQYMRVSNRYFEIPVLYDDGSGLGGCSIEKRNEGYQDIKAGNDRTCEAKFVFPRDVDIVDDIYLYYEIENFYQNHRRYVMSRSDSQLRNEITGSKEAIIDSLERDCAPDSSLIVENGSQRLVHYPCGLIAQSYFNDGIQMKSFNRTEEYELTWVNGVPDKQIFKVKNGIELDIELQRKDIAWATDLDNTFRNPTRPGNHPRYEVYQYLWQTYDQFSCYKRESPYNRTSCWSWERFVREDVQTDIPEGTFIPGKDLISACASLSYYQVNYIYVL